MSHLMRGTEERLKRRDMEIADIQPITGLEMLDGIGAHPFAEQELIISFAAIELVASGAPVEQIPDLAAVKLVVAFTAHKRVIALIAKQPIVALAAVDQIIATTAMDSVVAAAGENSVVSPKSEDGVVAVRPENVIIAIRSVNPIVKRIPVMMLVISAIRVDHDVLTYEAPRWTSAAAERCCQKVPEGTADGYSTKQARLITGGGRVTFSGGAGHGR